MLTKSIVRGHSSQGERGVPPAKRQRSFYPIPKRFFVAGQGLSILMAVWIAMILPLSCEYGPMNLIAPQIHDGLRPQSHPSERPEIDGDGQKMADPAHNPDIQTGMLALDDRFRDPLEENADGARLEQMAANASGAALIQSSASSSTDSPALYLASERTFIPESRLLVSQTTPFPDVPPPRAPFSHS